MSQKYVMNSLHHVAVTASDFQRSLAFYEKLGFEVLANRSLPEKQKKIALLSLGNFKLELFWFADMLNQPERRDSMGNNVKEVGAKHFAIRVDSLEQTINNLAEKGIPLESEPAMGDTGYQFCFIKDPDGIWIEYVQDDVYN